MSWDKLTPDERKERASPMWKAGVEKSRTDNRWKGRKHTPEARRKMSEKASARCNTEEFKEFIRAANARYQANMTDEERARISQRISESVKKTLASKVMGKREWKRRSEAQKIAWSHVSHEERVKRVSPGLAVMNSGPLHKGRRWKPVSSIEMKIRGILDEYGVRYKAQCPFDNGNTLYVVDIYIPKFNLIIECNGDYWHSFPKKKKRDEEIARFAKEIGTKIVFIWEHEINNSPRKALSKALKEVLN
jgi:very-short-patch-repair endonuclease